MKFIINLLIIIVGLYFFVKIIPSFNKKIDDKIKNDIRKYFESQNYKVINLVNINGEKGKDIPFNTRESFAPSLGSGGRNYCANHFWKITLIDHTNTEIIKWVNTGHFFMKQIYFIVK